MTQNHLKLMIDYTFGEAVAKKLNLLGKVRAQTTKAYGFPANVQDEEIINTLKETKHLLLTHDYNTINERRYPPCSHDGIILIMDRQWTEESIFEKMKAFCESGYRKYAHHCVTRLYSDKCKIFQHNNETLEFNF